MTLLRRPEGIGDERKASARRRIGVEEDLPLSSAGTPPPTPPPSAPVDAAYVLMLHNAALAQHRRLQASRMVTLTDGGPGGDATLDMNLGNSFGDSMFRFSIANIMGVNGAKNMGMNWTGGNTAITTLGTTWSTQMLRNQTATAAGAFTSLLLHGRHGAFAPYLWRGNGPGLGGFRCQMMFVWNQQDCPLPKWFIGWRGGNPTAPNFAAQASAQTDCIYLAADETDATLQVMHNDNVGVCNKIGLGPLFPREAVGDLHIFEISCPSNVDYVDWAATRATQISSVTVGSRITTNMPSSTTFLAPYQWLCNGSVGGVMKQDHLWMLDTQPYGFNVL